MNPVLTDNSPEPKMTDTDKIMDAANARWAAKAKPQEDRKIQATKPAPCDLDAIEDRLIAGRYTGVTASRVESLAMVAELRWLRQHSSEGKENG